MISMMEARLPPGFRFHPRDDELVLDYLCRKLSGGGGGAYGGIAMVDVDLNKCEPWELPGTFLPNLLPRHQLHLSTTSLEPYASSLEQKRAICILHKRKSSVDKAVA